MSTKNLAPWAKLCLSHYVSCFSTQLTATCERLGISMAELAKRAEVPVATVHSYAQGIRLPKAAQLEQIVASLPKGEATALVIARLQDEIGPSAAALVTLLPRGGRVEEPATPYMPAHLPEKLRRALEVLGPASVRLPDLGALLVNLASLHGPPGAPDAAARPRRTTVVGTSRSAALVSDRPA